MHKLVKGVWTSLELRTKGITHLYGQCWECSHKSTHIHSVTVSKRAATTIKDSYHSLDATDKMHVSFPKPFSAQSNDQFSLLSLNFCRVQDFSHL